MARPRACRSPCQNPLPVKRVINEPAEQALRALIDNNGFRALTLILPCAHRILLRSSLQ